MLSYHEFDNTIIAELTDEKHIISGIQDVLDLIGEAGSYPCNKIIIREENLNPDFFKLHTGLAGDILQKFSNYRVKLAIIGNFSKYRSKNLQDFIRESNSGNRIYFLNTLDAALCKLATTA